MLSTYDFIDAIRIQLGHKISTPPLAIVSFALMGKQGLLGAYVDQGTGQLLLPVGALATSSTLGIGYGAGAGGAVVQASSGTTAVTLNKPTGTITTVSLTTAAGATNVFTVNNSLVGLNDVPEVVVGTYAGAGIPVAHVKNVVAGAFDVVLQNVHASAALNAAVPLNFNLGKGSAS